MNTFNYKLTLYFRADPHRYLNKREKLKEVFFDWSLIIGNDSYKYIREDLEVNIFPKCIVINAKLIQDIQLINSAIDVLSVGELVDSLSISVLNNNIKFKRDYDYHGKFDQVLIRKLITINLDIESYPTDVTFVSMYRELELYTHLLTSESGLSTEVTYMCNVNSINLEFVLDKLNILSDFIRENLLNNSSQVSDNK